MTEKNISYLVYANGNLIGQLDELRLAQAVAKRAFAPGSQLRIESISGLVPSKFWHYNEFKSEWVETLD